MMPLSEDEVERAVALCDAIVQAAARMEKMIAEAKVECAQLARDLKAAMDEADKC